MAFIQERLRLIRAKMPEAFNTQVRGNVEVRRLPPRKSRVLRRVRRLRLNRRNHPRQVLDQSEMGFEHTKYDLPSLTHHEAIPGHVWQGEYAIRCP